MILSLAYPVLHLYKLFRQSENMYTAEIPFNLISANYLIRENVWYRTEYFSLWVYNIYIVQCMQNLISGIWPVILHQTNHLLEK